MILNPITLYTRFIKTFTKDTDDEICSVWMLTNTIGVPEETAAENQAIALVVVELISCSFARGMKRIELTTVDRWSGR